MVVSVLVGLVGRFSSTYTYQHKLWYDLVSIENGRSKLSDIFIEDW